MKPNLMLLFQMPNFTLKFISTPHLGEIVTKMGEQFFRGGLITKILYSYKDKTSETMWLEVTIYKQKWCITFAYRPPYYSSKDGFFKELHKSLSNIARKYENVLLVGDLNINIFDKKNNSKNYLFDLNDTFSLSNPISEVTC